MRNLLIVFAVLSCFFAVGAGLKCYQCASEAQAGCESSDRSALEKYITKCEVLKEGTYKGREATACRKILQDVESQPTRIIRECAYTGDSTLDGVRKQGNKAIKLTYYQCQNAEPNTPCNEAPSSMFASLLVVAVCALVAFR